MTGPASSAEGLSNSLTIRRRLLRWFRRTRRPLPWRTDPDPYKIWVSEIMLQQTRVPVVVEYYQRFLARFPTIASLAAAPQEEVLRLWEGLGYYRRASHLHAAARIVVQEHGGVLPRDPETLGRLPGIGRYTLGAILSQAFDQPWPAVDANAARVLCRLYAWAKPLSSPATQEWLQATASALLPRRGAGLFNQALMELGSLVCTARQPRCPVCPLRDLCLAMRQGQQTRLPLKSRPKLPRPVQVVAVVVRRQGRVLLLQHGPQARRWPGLWVFPHLELSEAQDSVACPARCAAEAVGIEVAGVRFLTRLRYGITRFRIEMDCYEAAWRAGRVCPREHAAARWMHADQLASVPMPAPHRRLARLILPAQRLPN
jgi:A/G-specific adenine glycosylase